MNNETLCMVLAIVIFIRAIGFMLYVFYMCDKESEECRKRFKELEENE